MTEQNENTGSDYKCCDYTEKNEKQNVRQIKQVGIPGPQGAFSDKVNPHNDSFNDEPVVQCDV